MAQDLTEVFMTSYSGWDQADDFALQFYDPVLKEEYFPELSKEELVSVDCFVVDAMKLEITLYKEGEEGHFLKKRFNITMSVE